MRRYISYGIMENLWSPVRVNTTSYAEIVKTFATYSKNCILNKEEPGVWTQKPVVIEWNNVPNTQK
jgi:hypothetical protein